MSVAMIFGVKKDPRSFMKVIVLNFLNLSRYLPLITLGTVIKTLALPA
jgi:hypothetical protein